MLIDTAWDDFLDFLQKKHFKVLVFLLLDFVIDDIQIHIEIILIPRLQLLFLNTAMTVQILL